MQWKSKYLNQSATQSDLLSGFLTLIRGEEIVGGHKHTIPTDVKELHINNDMGHTQYVNTHKQRVQSARNTNTDEILVEMKKRVCHLFEKEKPTWYPTYLVSWVELGAVMSGYVSV